jgi:hypothetical protein
VTLLLAERRLSRLQQLHKAGFPTFDLEQIEVLSRRTPRRSKQKAVSKDGLVQISEW